MQRMNAVSLLAISTAKCSRAASIHRYDLKVYIYANVCVILERFAIGSTYDS